MLDKILMIGKFLIENYQAILASMVGLLSALVAVFLWIPGPHPEDWFQAAAEFLKKFSKKPDQIEQK